MKEATIDEVIRNHIHLVNENYFFVFNFFSIAFYMTLTSWNELSIWDTYIKHRQVCMHTYIHGEGSLRCLMAKSLDCCFEVNEFKLLSRYYLHFQILSLGKDNFTKSDCELWVIMNPFILLAMDQVVSLLFFYKDGYHIKWCVKLWQAMK